MAIARVTIKCSVCGDTFEKTAIKINRREADKWESWAKNAIDMCPSCYAKKLAELDQQRPLTMVLTVSPYDIRPVKISWSGCTNSHRSELESLGYRWCEDGYKVVPQYFTLEEANAEYERIKSAGLTPEVDRQYSNGELIISTQNAKKMKEIADLERPHRPEWMGEGKWNGKVYGSSRSGYSVYVDGNKIVMSEEQHNDLQDYLEKCKKYQEEKARIESRIEKKGV